MVARLISSLPLWEDHAIWPFQICVSSRRIDWPFSDSQSTLATNRYLRPSRSLIGRNKNATEFLADFRFLRRKSAAHLKRNHTNQMLNDNWTAKCQFSARWLTFLHSYCISYYDWLCSAMTEYTSGVHVCEGRCWWLYNFTCTHTANSAHAHINVHHQYIIIRSN